MVTDLMKTYTFVLVLANVDEMTDDVLNAIYGSGVDDAMIRSEGPVVMVDFDREGETLGLAIDSAVKDVLKAGYKVARIIVEEIEQETKDE